MKHGLRCFKNEQLTAHGRHVRVNGVKFAPYDADPLEAGSAFELAATHTIGSNGSFRADDERAKNKLEPQSTPYKEIYIKNAERTLKYFNREPEKKLQIPKNEK